MTGLSDPRHCGTLLFYRGCTDFLFSVFQSIAVTVGSATIYVFTGFHPGEPSQQSVPSTSGSVRVACPNLTCGEGIFFWLWHKKSPDTKWYLPAQAPANTSFCTRIFYVKARTSLFCRPTPFRCQATHTTTLSLDAWLKKAPTDMKATGKHKDIRSRQARQSSYLYRIIFNCDKRLNISIYTS